MDALEHVLGSHVVLRHDAVQGGVDPACLFDAGEVPRLLIHAGHTTNLSVHQLLVARCKDVCCTLYVLVWHLLGAGVLPDIQEGVVVLELVDLVVDEVVRVCHTGQVALLAQDVKQPDCLADLLLGLEPRLNCSKAVSEPTLLTRVQVHKTDIHLHSNREGEQAWRQCIPYP